MAYQKISMRTIFHILILTLFLSFCFSGNAGAQEVEPEETEATTQATEPKETTQTQVQTLPKQKTCEVTGYSTVESSNPSVAQVKKSSSKKYTVTGLKRGKATLNCYNKNGKLKKKIYLLVTTDQSFVYSKSEVVLKKGQTKKVTAKTDFKSGITVKYVSSDNGVATVSEKGRITAVASGSATISARFYYRDTRVKTIRKKVNVCTCSYDKSSITLLKGDSQKVQATVSKGCTVKYSSSDKEIASVSSSGEITALRAGTAVISAKVYFDDQKVSTMKKTVNVKTKWGKNDPLRILFIGNSKTSIKDIPGCFEGIAKAMGENVQVSSITKSGRTLQYFADNKKSDIQAQTYDYVIIQEHTTNLTNYSEYLSGAKKIAKYVRQKNPNVKILVRACWVKSTSSQKTRMEAYTNTTKVATKIDAMVVNDGPAFDLCAETYPKISLYADEKHPSKEGAYLSACCVYATMFRQSPVGCTYKGNLNSQEKARDLQTIAEMVSF